MLWLNSWPVVIDLSDAMDVISGRWYARQTPIKTG